MMYFPIFLNYNFFSPLFFNECIQSFHIAGIAVECLSRDGHFQADAPPPGAGAAVSTGCFFANDMCRFLTLFKRTQ